MSLLSKNSTAAERARGCVFAENFRDASEVVRNNGTLVNGAKITKDGLVLDGINDYANYQIPDNLLNSTQVSFLVEFNPDFDAADGNTHYIYDTTAGSRFFLFKGSYVTYNNDLVVGFSSGTGILIPYATYSPYWKTGQKNKIAVCAVSSSIQVYLNNVQVLTSASAIITSKPSNIVIGASFAFASLFKGSISKLRVFNKKLTAKEVSDYYNNSIFSYKGTPLLENNLDLASHDASSLRTLDNTSGERHLIFGDGATSTTFPTKLIHITGYSTDGGDYLVTKNNVVDFFGGEITQVLVFRLGSSTVDSGGFLSSYENTTTLNFGAMYYYVAGSGLRFYVGGQGTNFATTPVLKPGNIYVAVGFHDGANTSLYVDGIKYTDAANPLQPSIATDMKMHLFVRHGITLFSKTGTQIFYNAFWNKALTPMQIHDLTLTLQRRFKNI